MTAQLPIQQEERTSIVDILRGFALLGVLFANFSGMLTNNVPQSIIDTHANTFDNLLHDIHTIFIHNKYITIFSILFGYGFGIILQRLENKNINSTHFFLRRMFWLFIFGSINLALWNGDILHVYATSGIILLLFERMNNRLILISAVVFMIVIPTAIRLYQRYYLPVIDDEAIVQSYYQAYKWGSLKDVVIVNYKTYPTQFIYTWIEWRDMSEALGKFLLGYFIVRKQILVRLNENMKLIKQVWLISLLITIVYIPLEILSDKKIISTPRFILYPIFKIGILAMALFYISTIVQLHKNGKLQWLMEAFRNIGRMTLTNYLMQTIIYIIILYGIGFGLLGEFSFSIIWASSLIIYFLQIVFSKWWLSKFYYGPAEWIWRQLTYKKRFAIIRRPAAR